MWFGMRMMRPLFFRKIMISVFLILWMFPVKQIGAESQVVQEKIKIHFARMDVVDIHFFKALVKEAFKRMEIELEVADLPPARAMMYLDDGTIDAAGPRNKSVEKKYTHIIRSPEIFFNNELTAFSTDPTIKLSGWNSLKDYRVAYQNGWIVYETHVKQAKQIDVMRTQYALFRYLTSHRTDLALSSKHVGLKVIRENNLKGVYLLAPPIDVRENYLYLHKKHAALAKEFAIVLRQLKADGTFLGLHNKIVSNAF